MDWTLVLSFRISAIFHCFFGSHFPSASLKWWCGSFFKISARDTTGLLLNTAGLLLDSADLLLDTTGLLLSALDFRACIFVDLLSKGLDSFSNLQKTHLNEKFFKNYFIHLFKTSGNLILEFFYFDLKVSWFVYLGTLNYVILTSVGTFLLLNQNEEQMMKKIKLKIFNKG